MLIYALILGVLSVSFNEATDVVHPDEDQGRLMMMVQMPAGSSYTRTDAVLREVENISRNSRRSPSTLTIVGLNGDQASANGFLDLKDWSERKGKGQDAASTGPQDDERTGLPTPASSSSSRRRSAASGRAPDSRSARILPATATTPW